jgi:arabinose-5-phosphate isomerase
MSSQPAHLIPFGHFEQIRMGRSIIRQEADALSRLAESLGRDFCRAVEVLLGCHGSVIVTGVGKAGLIGQKLTATLSSTGTRSHFLHPTEAVHGDLGCVHPDDIVLALSNSGETEEVCRLLPILKGLGIPVIAMTATDHSSLGQSADVVLQLGRLREAGTHQLAPSTSTTAMLALGDALALTVSEARGFTPGDFALFHPAGSLGRQLSAVRDVMRGADELRIASEQTLTREVLASTEREGRRTGAVILTDDTGKLSGLFTDSDLARLLAMRQDGQLDRPISEVMTRNPVTLPVEASLAEAVDLLTERKVSELPVVDRQQQPVGLIDITDVIGLMPNKVNYS